MAIDPEAPDRAARLWVALAVGPVPEATELPDRQRCLGHTMAPPGRQRRLRLLRLGWLWCRVWQITTGGLPLPQRVVPEPWPNMPGTVVVVTFHQNTLEDNET